jgi:hypothetical protein
MELGMILVRAGSRIAAFLHRELDAAEVLHIRAIVELIGVTGGWVSDQEPEWPALFSIERLAPTVIDDNTLSPNRLEGN